MSNHHAAIKTQAELAALFAQDLTTGVGRSVKHDSAAKHVSGEAQYIDDRLEFPNQLHLYARLSDRAHARILSIDTAPCYAFEGVRIAITHEDVPGLKDIGPLLPGDPLLAIDTVQYVGQVVLAVAARDLDTARKAAMAAVIEYEDLEPVLDVVEAFRKKHFVLDSHTHQRGDSAGALAAAKHRIQGTLHIGGQEHFYLETQISSVMPTEDGGMIVYCSTQNPTEVQKLVAEVLDVSMNKIVVDMRRMGGGFGGKETQAASPACLCAVVARLTGQPAKMRLPRVEDMLMTGKRHPFYIEYDVGFDDTGRLHGIQLELAGNCGCSPDLSNSIVDRAMFHSDNAYYLGDATVNGHRCKTNTASNTAYRGFGGPQGMVAIEEVMDAIARHLALDPLAVRKANYYGKTERNVTHYYQTVEHNLLEEMTAELEASSQYAERREAIRLYNAHSPVLKKGLALTPVKFGISFTASFLNQAGALIHIYTDGSIHLNHGGTEMGQGLNTKVAQVVAEVFQVDISRVQITATNTDKVPNTSPTAASSGADLNGKAAQNAAETIKQRLVEFAARKYEVSEADVQFHNGHVRVRDQILTFEALIQQAYFAQVSLSSTGFYKTPKIYYDRSQARGRPFYYFAFGAACCEVIVDTLTGEYKMLRTDILHDVGASLNPAIDIGQVEGGFVQGMGWLTMEELVWNSKGKLMTNGPASYKIPAVADMPLDLRVKLVENRKNPEDTVFHSKAVGEPPFMLGIASWCAIKDAVASLGDYRHQPKIDAPATPERVLWGCEQMRQLRTADRSHAQRGDDLNVEVTMNDWISALADLQNRGEPCVLVTIIEELGSTPRNAGSKMVVSAARTFDTIGGGHLEYKAMQIARDMLASGQHGTHLERFSLGASLGQCCGGATVLLFEPMGQVQAHIAVFGAGHVARALVPLLSSLPCRVRWIDSREQEFPEHIPQGVSKIVSEEPVDEIADLPVGSYCIVITHNHALDLELTAALLKRNDFTYFGLIGSKTKRVKFEHRLRDRGFDSAQLQRMRCPMGLSEVKGKLPVEIAISIAGEIIATYNANFGQHTARAEPIAQLLPASRRSQATN